MESLALVPQVLKCHLGGSMPGASTLLYIYFKSKVLKLPYMYLRYRVNGIKRPWARLGQNDHEVMSGGKKRHLKLT